MLLSTDRADLQALEEFEVDSADIGQLERQISAFNMFEAVGMISQEIHHSRFLAFLLDPSQNHGLHGTFVKRFLSMVVRANPNKMPPVSVEDIDGLGFEDAEVAREQDHIDIGIRVPSCRLIIVIENKIYSGEHSDQLKRYLHKASARDPGWKVLPIYLTLDGTDATENRYLTASYVQIAELVDDLANHSSSDIGSEISTMLQHYAQMLRRHHLPNTEIDDICARIYQRHKRALDLIFERRPDRQGEIASIIHQMLSRADDIVVLNPPPEKRNIAFKPIEWTWHSLCSAGPNPKSDSGLVFIVWNPPSVLQIQLLIVPVQNLALSQRLWDFAASAGGPFRRNQKASPGPWARIYCKDVLDSRQLNEWEQERIEARVRQAWTEFIAGDLAKIRAMIAAEFGPASGDDGCAASGSEPYASEMVFETRPDPQYAIANLFVQLIDESDGLSLLTRRKAYILFGTPELDLPTLRTPGPWNADDMMALYFAVNNRPPRVEILLQITPVYDQSLRQKLWNLAESVGAPFAQSRRGLPAAGRPSIYKKIVFDGTQLADWEPSDIDAHVRKMWDEFITNDLPRMRTAIAAEFR